MRKPFFTFLWAFPVLFLATGCASRVNLSEVLQQSADSKVRTAYHLWYTNPEEISALNCMSGEFLPAGSVIEPIEMKRGAFDAFGTVTVGDGLLHFRDEAGKEYKVLFDEREMMMPIETFMRQFFTTATPEEIYKDVPENELERVKAGKIERGMHVGSVLVLLGPPAPSRTTLRTNQSWLYWSTPDSVFRLVFKGDKIRQIITLDELPQ